MVAALLLLTGWPAPPAAAKHVQLQDETAVLDAVIGGTDYVPAIGLGGGAITLDFRQADLRDVLSALAIKMGVSILLVDKAAGPVTFEAQGVTPGQALELILQSQQLSYLREGNVLVIGSPSTLQSNFFKQMVLTRFNLVFIPATKLKPLIGELGIPLSSITLDTNPYAIWAQGTPQALHKLQELIVAVDRLDNESSVEYRTLTATQVSPVRLQELLGQAGLDAAQTVILGNRLLVFDRTLHQRWPQVESLAWSLDTLDARERTVFVYQLKNISAADAATRLEAFDFEDVKTETFNYAEISQEILVICPPHLQTEVRSALAGMDGTRQKIRVPVASTTGDLAYTRLHAQRDLLSQLSGVSIGDIHISRNLSGDSTNPHYVMWVEESPEKIRQIEELVSRF